MSIFLKKGREESFTRKHPWLFSGAIQNIDKQTNNGDIVKILSNNGDFLCWGAYQQEASIAVRILSYHEESFGVQSIVDLFVKADNLRKDLLDSSNLNAYRAFFGESDGLSGLIIDRYNDNIVVQVHQYYILHNLALFKSAITLFFKEYSTIYLTIDEKLLKAHPSFNNEYWLGSSSKTIINEYGHQFEVNWVEGQKTGFFLDQRENRFLLAKYSKGKKVLNTFCYSGGFSVYALKAGASSVVSVDVSGKAIDLTDVNVALNGDFNNHSAIKMDTFDYFKNTNEDFDLIILDPPAFAKHIKSKHNAVIGYKRLNAVAMKKLNPGGILFTFSCSQVVDKELFLNTIRASAYECGKTIQILNYLEQPCDHPVMSFFPEGEYLKGLVLRIVD